MEALYTTLQGEIRSFKEHMRSCQQAFDVHTLYNVLRMLPGDGGRKGIQSLEQLEQLVASMERDGKDAVRIAASHKKSDIPSYISWFVSYVRYLGSLKETFDNKIVVPLCENLYVNDDPLPLDTLPFGGRDGHATDSVAHTAKQLFDLRRKWALLLKGGMIDEQLFSCQSLLDLKGFANIHSFVKIMRLVPDIFHKSLATAELAWQWVEIHGSRHCSQEVCSDPSSVKKGCDSGMAVDSLEHQSGLPQYQYSHRGGWSQSKASCISGRRDAGPRAAIQGRDKLHEVYGELMSLLWREERSWMLEAEIQKLNQRISSLHVQGQDKERELETLEYQLGKDNWRIPVTQHQTILCELEALERQLRLEEYRKNILQGDWLLELELQERCQELARVLQEREEAPKDLPQPANGLDSHSSYSSGALNTLSSDP